VRQLNDWRVRAFYISCLVVVPFLKFLLWNDYGFLRLEVLAAVALLAGASALLGWVGRGIGFYAVVAVCLLIATVYPIEAMLPPAVSVAPWALAGVLGGVVAAAMLLMRDRFFPVMAVFAWSVLLVQAVEPHWSGTSAKARTGIAGGDHTLWLVLDEHIGLNGFPDCAECLAAKSRLSETFRKYNFTVFPNAYSNYADTIDSIPSVVNHRLLSQPQELIAGQGSGLRQYAFRRNLLFEEFHARGYQVVGYQHGSLRSCLAGFGDAECREYRDKLGWLDRAPGGWLDRFRWLVGTYQAGDPWRVKVKGFFPFRFGLKITGPLSVAEVWPNTIAHDILGEQKKTLFFAHLLTPHSPYLNRRDGRVRALEEWSGDRADQRVGPEEYRERYGRYCEQVEDLAGQLDRFFAELDERGVLRRMTVVVHGDHGSRIRRILDGKAANAGNDNDHVAPSAWDYPGQPDERDLVDRFSTLLAVKKAGATAPASIAEKHSLLTLLSRYVFSREPEAGVDSADDVFLVNADGKLAPIDIRKYWR
jgi:hypothetical protein